MGWRTVVPSPVSLSVTTAPDTHPLTSADGPLSLPASAVDARNLVLGLHNVAFPCGCALELWRLYDRAEAVN
jgi:hypothetical protein